MAQRLKQNEIDAISAQLAAEMAEMVGAEKDATPFDPGKKGLALPRKQWVPLHGPVQTEIMNDRSDIVGACGEKFTGKCVHPNTLVYTPSGIIRIGSMKPTESKFGFTPIRKKVWSFDGTKLIQDTANQFYRETTTQALKFTFSNGKAFTCSPWHPLWCCYCDGENTRFGYLKASEIADRSRRNELVYTPLFGAPKDRSVVQNITVKIPHVTCVKCNKKATNRGFCDTHRAQAKRQGNLFTRPLKAEKTINITEALAYAIGALCGDGSCNAISEKGRSIGFSNLDQECIVGVREGLAELGASLTLSDHKYQYRVVGGKIAKQILIALGLDCLAYTKSIPDPIFASPRSVLVSFLKGLFDTDGTVDKIGIVSMTTVSERLADDVMEALQIIGIVAAKRFKNSASRRPTWNIFICGRQAWKFKSLVGFKISRKQQRIKMPKPSKLFPDGFSGGGYGYPKFISQDLRKMRDSFYASQGTHPRAWHIVNRGTLSFNCTPGQEKLQRIMELLKCHSAMVPYLVSENWVSAAKVETTTCELVDLSVEKTNSFIGNGFANHNSICFLDKIVAHCYLEFDALFTIIGNSHRALAEGVCHDMMTFTLPRWRDGNREPLSLWEDGHLVPNPREGDLIDHGIGLDFSPWKADPNNKDLYLKIRNQFGGWSRIRVIAIPFAEMVQARVTNLNASGFYLEEATRCNGSDYYTWPALQLHRRRGIKGPQQFLFSCNPDDPANWVYPWMYKECAVTKNDPGRDWPKDPEKPGIRREPGVAFYYLHYRENMHNVSQKNREILKRTLRANPILRARLLESKWLAMPEGDALFKAAFDAGKHVKGDAEKKRGLTPIPGYPIIIGLDWGKRNVGVVFKQIIESAEGPFKLTFGELSYFQEFHKTRELARAIMELMRYWNIWLRDFRSWEEETAKRDEFGLPIGAPSWCFWFIAGDDATTNVNPETGNIDARDLQDHMIAIMEEEPLRFYGMERPIIRGCPRPKESVSKRVDIVTEDLMSDMAAISDLCEGVKGMFHHLARDKESPSTPAGGNRWIHLLDAYSYPDYYRRFVLPGGFYNLDEGAAVEVA